MSPQYSYAMSAPRVKPLSIVVALMLGGIALFTLVGLVKAGPGGLSAFTQASFQSHASLGAVTASIWDGLRLSTFSLWYWAFVAFLTILQWFWPARRDERTFSVDMAVDAVWFVMGNAMQFTIVAATLGAVTVAYTELLGTWSLNLEHTFGFWGLATFAFVLTDLLAWITHWCHHKVPTLWRFHAVHHSQRRLNALSDNRTHIGEVVAAALIVFVPSQLLGLNASAAMGLAFLGLYYSAMLHSNIRTNFGPLRFVFLGPQFHRVHHSTLPQHFDTNFGTVFSWWDYLARTMYKGYDEYPPTGIQDETFPLREQGDLNPWRWLVIFSKQLAYPFQGLVIGPAILRTVREVSDFACRNVTRTCAQVRGWRFIDATLLRHVGSSPVTPMTEEPPPRLAPLEYRPVRRDRTRCRAGGSVTIFGTARAHRHCRDAATLGDTESGGGRHGPSRHRQRTDHHARNQQFGGLAGVRRPLLRGPPMSPGRRGLDADAAVVGAPGSEGKQPRSIHPTSKETSGKDHRVGVEGFVRPP